LSELTPEERGIHAGPERLVPASEAPVVEVLAPARRSSWKVHLVSVVERSVSTFAFSFLGLITATNMSDPTAMKAAALAGGFSVAVYLRVVAGSYLASTPDAG
jgi:hypothetical protein